MNTQMHEAHGRLIKATQKLADSTLLDGTDVNELAWLIGFDDVSAALGEFSAASREAGHTQP